MSITLSTRLVLAAGLAALTAAAVPSVMATQAQAAAPAKKAPAKTVSKPQVAWKTTCSSATRGAPVDCALEQRVVIKETGQLLAGMSIRVPAQTRKPVMMVQVPLGLYLPEGIKLSFDGKKPIQIGLQYCDQKGCYAGQPVSPEMLKGFRTAKELKMSFQNLQRQDLTVNIVLSQFAASYDKIK